MSLYCTTVVPKRSRDSVSDDVSFRRPAKELLVVTMHSWAQLRHTTSGFHPTQSTSYWLKCCHDVFDASTHAFMWGAAEFTSFSRSYGIFPGYA